MPLCGRGGDPGIHMVSVDGTGQINLTEDVQVVLVISGYTLDLH